MDYLNAKTPKKGENLEEHFCRETEKEISQLQNESENYKQCIKRVDDNIGVCFNIKKGCDLQSTRDDESTKTHKKLNDIKHLTTTKISEETQEQLEASIKDNRISKNQNIHQKTNQLNENGFKMVVKLNENNGNNLETLSNPTVIPEIMHKRKVSCDIKSTEVKPKTVIQQPIIFKSQSFDLADVLETPNAQNVYFELPEISEGCCANSGLCSLTKEDNSTHSETLTKKMSGIKSFNVTEAKKFNFKNSDNADSVFEECNTENSEKSICNIQAECNTTKMQTIENRPIYPNVPYSPYGSPYGSPRTNRKPPLRESRRISIERSGSFLQLNQYKLMDQIGQGSYGLVKLAYSEEDSTHYAMKILSKKRLLRQAGLMKRVPKKVTSPLDRVYREIAVLKKLDHPNVVKLIEVLDDPIEDSLYMVFELVKLGAVLNIPTDKPLCEERAWNVFRETLLGLEYLHYQRIIHADLKPGNLLLTECGHVKIADLGVCNEFLGEDATMSNGSTAGTPAFRSPETLVFGKHLYCGKAADIWALGATLYSLVFGNVPFIANSIPLLYEKIKNDELLFPTNPNVSEDLKDCIMYMLTKEPKNRVTLPKLKEHIWVTKNGLHPLPSEKENCRLVQISEDDLNSVVRSIPKLDTLILIKTMLKKHSFGNPFFKESYATRTSARGGSRLERFARAGRSNSAPGSYHLAIDRQQSNDSILPALSELCSSTNGDEQEKR